MIYRLGRIAMKLYPKWRGPEVEKTWKPRLRRKVIRFRSWTSGMYRIHIGV